VGSQANLEAEQKEKTTMEVINGSRSNEQQEKKDTSGVLADGTKWEIVPRCTVTRSVLTKYLAVVTNAAEAAINIVASDPVEEAARALAVGFGAAMVSHGRRLSDEGYEQGDFECKASLGLLGEDGKETAQYNDMLAETDAKRKAEREAERLTRE
jgi:hypothetical protein